MSIHHSKNSQPMLKHIILTSLSAKPYETVYTLNGRTSKASQSPVALVQLLGCEQRPQEIIVLCTKKLLDGFFVEAQKAVGNLFDADSEQDCNCLPYSEINIIPLAIPDGTNTEELWESLRLILQSVPRGCRLTLDLTHGFRSFPFLFFTAALFLKALHDCEIAAVYYGMSEASSSEGKPFVDLSPVLEMTEWFYATRIFRETGQASGLTSLLREFASPPEGMKGPSCKPYSQVKALRESVDAVARAFAQALPVEFGIEAANLWQRLAAPVPQHLSGKMPLPEALFNEIRSFVEPFVLHDRRSSDKTDISLDMEELRRQEGIIDTYLKQGYVNFAIDLMREFMVSTVMLHQGMTSGNEWLSYSGNNDRKPIERKMGIMYNIHRLVIKGSLPDCLSEGQKWLAEHWQALTNKRNDLHHHGFKKDYGLINDSDMDKIGKRWQDIKASLNDAGKWDLTLAGVGGKLLVSPLGLSRGLLYTALRKVKPDRLYLISSVGAVEALDEIMAEAEWSGRVEKYIMSDPHSGFFEAGEIVKHVLPLLPEIDGVTVNVTGGTTAMQYIVQKIAGRAADIGRPVVSVAMVDRRGPQEQRDNPYVEGDIIRLDSATD